MASSLIQVHAPQTHSKAVEWLSKYSLVSQTLLDTTKTVVYKRDFSDWEKRTGRFDGEKYYSHSQLNDN